VQQQRRDTDWSKVVAAIQQGDPAGEEILYRTLVNGARLFLKRRLGTEDVDDRVHDIFLVVIQAIRRGEIEHPERLMGFVRTVLYRTLSSENRRGSRQRQETEADPEELSSGSASPEEQAIDRQKLALMQKVLREMSKSDFEVLSRFYLREQPPQRVCAEMGLTQVQFQLLKSRAKARLADLVRRKVKRPSANRG
jgi:RNA polymerase sigma-70 factor (ECF subfamily)